MMNMTSWKSNFQKIMCKQGRPITLWRKLVLIAGVGWRKFYLFLLDLTKDCCRSYSYVRRSLPHHDKYCMQYQQHIHEQNDTCLTLAVSMNCTTMSAVSWSEFSFKRLETTQELNWLNRSENILTVVCSEFSSPFFRFLDVPSDTRLSTSAVVIFLKSSWSIRVICRASSRGNWRSCKGLRKQANVTLAKSSKSF